MSCYSRSASPVTGCVPSPGHAAACDKSVSLWYSSCAISPLPGRIFSPITVLWTSSVSWPHLPLPNFVSPLPFTFFDQCLTKPKVLLLSIPLLPPRQHQECSGQVQEVSPCTPALLLHAQPHPDSSQMCSSCGSVRAGGLGSAAAPVHDQSLLGTSLIASSDVHQSSSGKGCAV